MNTLRGRGVSARDVVAQAAFAIGVSDWRAGAPLREGDSLPPLVGLPDSPANRARTYETGRLVAAYARDRRRGINAATALAAKAAGYIPGWRRP